MAARVLTGAEARMLSHLPPQLKAADALLRGQGLPSRRHEQWKWSDLRAAVDETVQFVVRADIDPAAQTDTQGDIIAALASAFGVTERLVVRAGDHVTRMDRPRAGNFQPSALSVEVEPGGRFTRIVVQEQQAGVALDSARVRLGAGATFRQFTLAEGAKLARLETKVEIAGEGAKVELSGVYLCGEKRHADLTSVVTHNAVGGETRQLIKGAARKGGRGVFQGRIEVARGAQKTDARQHHHGLMLEDGSEIYAKPELEIYADDVQCAHGNTIGALDDAALFYMRTRGIPETQAQAMLTEAFLLEAVPDNIPGRDEIEARIKAWLGGAS
jgi:Fe-S cluster assembly protein SufD